VVRAAIQVDPIERRGRKQCLQAHGGRFGEALPKKCARGPLTRRVGQSRGDMADQGRIVFADIDFNAHEATTRHPRAVTGKRGFSPDSHFRTSPYFRKYYRKTRKAASRKTALVAQVAFRRPVDRGSLDYRAPESFDNSAIASCTVVMNCAGKMMVEFFSIEISAIVCKVRS
jgi:hypothetical protein